MGKDVYEEEEEMEGLELYHDFPKVAKRCGSRASWY